MLTIKIDVDKDGDLRDVFDQISDGELDDIAKLSEIKADRVGAALFAAGSKRMKTLVVSFRGEPDDELIARLIAAIRILVGRKAHIEYLD